jgi:hypothetical protein
MKHGHKAKEKSAKALEKPRSEKNRKVAGKKSAAPGKTSAPGKASAPAKSNVKSAGKGAHGHEAVPSRGTVREQADHRKAAAGPPSFSNPAVASAFRRALKKYSVALKRLTD